MTVNAIYGDCIPSTPTDGITALLVDQLDVGVMVQLDIPEGIVQVCRGRVILDAVTEYTVREIAQRCAEAVVTITTPAPVTDVQRLCDGRRAPAPPTSRPSARARSAP